MRQNTTEMTQGSLSDIGNMLSSTSTFYFYEQHETYTSVYRNYTD